jgi:hypothetical protein
MVLGSVSGVNGAVTTIKVGIGTTEPQARLHLKSNSTAGAINSQLLLEEDENDYTRITMRNAILPGSYWDIAALTNASNANARLNFYFSGGNDILSLKGDGNATLAGILTQLSDSRLKKNIVPIPSSLSRLVQLNGYQYHWKETGKDESTQLGVLAQEVLAIFPELVKKDEKGLLSVNYSGLVPVLINAVKEQQNTINNLVKRLEALEQKSKD